MKHPFNILPITIAIILGFTLMIPITIGTGEPAYSECEARCSGFTGQSLVRCLETCIRMKKRQGAGENRVKKKMARCEKICEELSGLDQVRCLRVCLDKLVEE